MITSQAHPLAIRNVVKSPTPACDAVALQGTRRVTHGAELAGPAGAALISRRNCCAAEANATVVFPGLAIKVLLDRPATPRRGVKDGSITPPRVPSKLSPDVSRRCPDEANATVVFPGLAIKVLLDRPATPRRGVKDGSITPPRVPSKFSPDVSRGCPDEGSADVAVPIRPSLSDRPGGPRGAADGTASTRAFGPRQSPIQSMLCRDAAKPCEGGDKSASFHMRPMAPLPSPRMQGAAVRARQHRPSTTSVSSGEALTPPGSSAVVKTFSIPVVGLDYTKLRGVQNVPCAELETKSVSSNSCPHPPTAAPVGMPFAARPVVCRSLFRASSNVDPPQPSAPAGGAPSSLSRGRYRMGSPRPTSPSPSPSPSVAQLEFEIVSSRCCLPVPCGSPALSRCSTPCQSRGPSPSPSAAQLEVPAPAAQLESQSPRDGRQVTRRLTPRLREPPAPPEPPPPEPEPPRATCWWRMGRAEQLRAACSQVCRDRSSTPSPRQRLDRRTWRPAGSLSSAFPPDKEMARLYEALDSSKRAHRKEHGPTPEAFLALPFAFPDEDPRFGHLEEIMGD